MDDLISRQAAIKLILSGRVGDDSLVECPEECNSMLEWAADEVAKMPTADPVKWIPVKTRPMTEDERKYYEEIYSWTLSDDEAVIFDCKMPEDGQEVWVCSRCGNVWDDICIIEDGIGLEGNGDWFDIVAWMPCFRPEPWRGEEDGAD